MHILGKSFFTERNNLYVTSTIYLDVLCMKSTDNIKPSMLNPVVSQYDDDMLFSNQTQSKTQYEDN